MPRRQSRPVRAGWLRPLSRALALAAVFLQLTATIGGTIHLALVRHERCPEHGELIHGHRASHAGEVTLLGRGALPDELAEVFRADPDVAPGSHDDCPIVGLARQRYDARTTALRLTPVQVAAAPSSQAPQPFLGAMVASYRLAPKTSPPVAAAS